MEPVRLRSAKVEACPSRSLARRNESTGLELAECSLQRSTRTEEMLDMELFSVRRTGKGDYRELRKPAQSL